MTHPTELPNSVHHFSEPEVHRTAFFEYLRIILMVLAIFAYFFNVLDAKTFVDNFAHNLNVTLHARTGQVNELVSEFWPILLFAVLAFIVFLTLRGAIGAFRRLSKSAQLSRRALTPLEDFVALAARHRISTTVARHAYHLLEPCYDGFPSIRFTDRLDKLLHLNHVERADLLATLLRDSGRLAMPNPEQHDVLTILELLQTAENSPARLRRNIA